ncbi:DUF2726 domain-containing protein [Truepera radiovictrix]|uniref:DUF2726 domain-containing protein n=1 Tax=Truepera radiovictrix (strain DSM 17093 / CIP 108686 / LMG 22925 / RQ-24) TaxID=649638 RepID=D7CRE1_TRURR|nr:DUF2726 domain-containing protein [Truepera radiovictrix]ADI15229.1 conserved hypothetical protein [Truepera radiovictrix DSM 17093]WMT56218.1 DUF2726 domain-containing protein [Truepera radiovictrix]
MTSPLSLPLDLPLPALLLALALLIVLLIVTLLSAKRARREPATYPYVARAALFTPAERAFLRQLEAALQGQPYRVFGKVRLSDLVSVKGGLAPSERQRARNRIAAKHVDFALCDPHSARILCAIELDDKTHARPERRARDAFVERALAAAGVPLLRFPVQPSPCASALREAVAALPHETAPRRQGR